MAAVDVWAMTTRTSAPLREAGSASPGRSETVEVASVSPCSTAVTSAATLVPSSRWIVAALPASMVAASAGGTIAVTAVSPDASTTSSSVSDDCPTWAATLSTVAVGAGTNATSRRSRPPPDGGS